MSDNTTIFPRAFACFNKNKKVLLRGSSGGVFFALASSIINNYHGVVYGCVVNNGHVFHKRAKYTRDLFPILGSKYVRSDLKDTFLECKKDLNNGLYVLYSGTPCQIGALHFFLEQNNVDIDKLLSVDVICHGTPKPYYWNKYLDLNFKNKDISSINFRYKKTGWENFYIKIGEYEAPFKEDPYMRAFLENRILCESCFSCKFKGENRKADVTLGDFRGIDNVDYRSKNHLGTSLMIARRKLAFVFSLLGKKVFLKEMPYLDSFYLNNPSYYKSVQRTDLSEITDSDLLINQNMMRSEKEKRSLKHRLYNLFYKRDSVGTSVVFNNAIRCLSSKVGIITDFGYYNYGNRLQNYALISLLKQFNKKPYNIVPIKNKKILPRRIICFFRGNQKKRMFGIPIKNSILSASSLYENKTIFISKSKKDRKKMLDFETIIVGSDQIWNAGYHKYENDLEFSLGNHGIMNRPYRLISYAASICLPFFDEDNKESFYYSLLNFDRVSVREKASFDLLDSIKIPARIDVDPTLLLTKEKWNKAIQKYSSIDYPLNEYIFLYLLGSDNFVLEKTYGITNVVNVLEKGSRYYDANQFDFVNLIKNSSLVITDSFHALVFSIIFEKKIVLIKRLCFGMEQRIEELMNLISTTLVYNQVIDLSKCDKTKLISAINDSYNYLEGIIK